MRIDGKKIAESITARLASLPKTDKFLGAVLAGNDPASLNFLKQKEKVARELGIDFRLYELPKGISTDDLRREIGRLAAPKNCGGFIVQLPLPEYINQQYVLNAIPKAKDIDFLSEGMLGAFYTGRAKLTPPSVGVLEEILNIQGYSDLRKLKAAVIGTGLLIGKPIGFWLQNKVGSLAVFDSKTPDLHMRLHDADIVVSGAGKPKLFGVKHLKQGALVLDFGYGRIDGKISGDFDPEDAEEKSISYTPTPGGTGPILVAKLYENFFHLNN